VFFSAQVCDDQTPYRGLLLLCPRALSHALLGTVQTPRGTVAAYSRHDLLAIIAKLLREEGGACEDGEEFDAAREIIRDRLIPSIGLLGERRPLVLRRGRIDAERTGAQFWFQGEPWIADGVW
jgi:hypothetical protein